MKNQSNITVIWPLGVSGGSQVTTIVDELNGRTCILRGALSIAIVFTKIKWLCYFYDLSNCASDYIMDHFLIQMYSFIKKHLYLRKDMIKSTYLLMTTLLGLIRLIINYTQGQRPCFQNKDATKMRIYLNNECITILSKKYREIYKETKNQTLIKTETYSTLSIILF